jgi:DNA repair exonuclease SbcCD ATPase subunit
MAFDDDFEDEIEEEPQEVKKEVVRKKKKRKEPIQEDTDWDKIDITKTPAYLWEKQIEELQKAVKKLQDHEKQLQQMMRSVMQRGENLDNRINTSTTATRTLREFVEGNMKSINEYAECIHTLEQRITEIEGQALETITETTPPVADHNIILIQKEEITRILKSEEPMIDMIELLRSRNRKTINAYNDKHGTHILGTGDVATRLTRMFRLLFNNIRELK